MTEAAPFIGLVPARGGSKSIPRKNLALLAGRPLLAYTAEAALGSTRLARTLLSTDDPEIAEVGRSLGLEVPFLRPAELAGDTAGMLGVMCHALDMLAADGVEPRALVLLQPTSPLRRADHIDAAIALFESAQAETVVSVMEVPHQFNPTAVMSLVDGRLIPFLPGTPILRRQDKPRVLARNGPAILAVAPAALRRGMLYGEPTIGYIMDAAESHDIDEPADLWLVEQYLKWQGGNA